MTEFKKNTACCTQLNHVALESIRKKLKTLLFKVGDKSISSFKKLNKAKIAYEEPLTIKEITLLQTSTLQDQ